VDRVDRSKRSSAVQAALPPRLRRRGAARCNGRNRSRNADGAGLEMSPPPRSKRNSRISSAGELAATLHVRRMGAHVLVTARAEGSRVDSAAGLATTHVSHCLSRRRLSLGITFSSFRSMVRCRKAPGGAGAAIIAAGGPGVNI